MQSMQTFTVCYTLKNGHNVQMSIHKCSNNFFKLKNVVQICIRYFVHKIIRLFFSCRQAAAPAGGPQTPAGVVQADRLHSRQLPFSVVGCGWRSGDVYSPATSIHASRPPPRPSPTGVTSWRRRRDVITRRHDVMDAAPVRVRGEHCAGSSRDRM